MVEYRVRREKRRMSLCRTTLKWNWVNFLKRLFQRNGGSISEGESSPSPVDTISNLCDHVLSYILSFLPTTKEAAATSILSKRWRYVWTCVDNLKFNSCLTSKKKENQFAISVYEVLKLHQGNIKDFTLFGFYFDKLDVFSWIDTAISKGVERLDLDICFKGSEPGLPLSMLSSETLVDLRLWRLYDFGKDIPISTTPIFPCLKKLHVSVCDYIFLILIVSRCPALEHLIIGWNTTPLPIVSSSMKRLEITYNPTIEEKVFLSAPSLQYLKFCRSISPFELVVKEQLSSLIQADFCFCPPFINPRNLDYEAIRDSFVRFIQHFSNVKLLRVEIYFFSRVFKSVGHALFINLTKLEIVSSSFAWRLVLSFIENSINLEAISLKKMSIKRYKLDWKEPANVPTSLSSSLKKISIDGYGEEELPMVKYVLRTAQILERVDIRCCAECYNNDWKSNMLQNLQKLYKASERCEIFLV